MKSRRVFSSCSGWSNMTKWRDGAIEATVNCGVPAISAV